MLTLDALSSDGLDGDVGVVLFVVPFEDVPVLSLTDFSLENVVIYNFRHQSNNSYAL